jgi:hypothetical protein
MLFPPEGSLSVTMPTLVATVIIGSPGMLGLLAAAAVPWLIARRHRARLKAVGLATTSILIDAARRQPLWQRPPQSVVPLLRSLLIAAVVVAAAGPAWRSPPPGPSTIQRILILDDSDDGQASRAVLAAVDALAETAGSSGRFPRAETVRSAVLASGTLSADTRVVILADGASPSKALQRRLAAWVAEGGGLVVLLGPQSTAPEASLPAAWLAEVGGVRLNGLREGDPEPIRAAPDAMPDLGLLSGPSVSAHAILEPVIPCEVLLETEGSSRPLLVACRNGRGMVVVSALPWGLPEQSASPQPVSCWSDLTLWPGFLEVVAEVLDEASPASFGEQDSPLARDRQPMPAGRPLAGIFLLAAVILAGLEPLAAFVLGAGGAPA